jgi:hypothetical protein
VHFGSISCAATLALAVVLAFAAVVTCTTAAFAFARVLSLAAMFLGFVGLALLSGTVILLLDGGYAGALALFRTLCVKFGACACHQTC